MKYYKLTKDLPTFKKGELFYIDSRGHLISCAHKDIVAYSAIVLEKYPNVLTDWFVEVPAPERDSKTKYAFMEYISDHKDERFFQAIRNFTRLYLYEDATYITAGPTDEKMEGDYLYADTFYWECDEMMQEKLDAEEDARANEY